MRFQLMTFCLSVLLLANCQKNTADDFTHELGMFTAYCEAVSAGAKPMALSEPMSSNKMDAFLRKAKPIADQYGVSIFRESELIATDLFPESVAAGKEVLLLYQGQTLNAYQRLKADQQAWQEAGDYEATRQMEVARRMGRLLGYSPRGINRMLAEQTDFRTMQDFGVQASNTFLYYKDLAGAADFYGKVLGLRELADYGSSRIFQLSQKSLLILVDEKAGMHRASEPKSVALAFLTDQLEEWWAYLNTQEVPVKYPLKVVEEGPHDGFVMIDPEGYLLEFERFKQHPENEKFIPALAECVSLPADKNSDLVPEGLGFKASITWLYYQDLLEIQQFYEEVLGLKMVADQGWTKIYQVSESGFIGLVDERRGMCDYAEDKAVTVSFLLESPRGWYDYVREKEIFPLRTGEWEEDEEGRYEAFVGFDPGKYYMEFDRFLDHSMNTAILEQLQ
ncbi:MAG TPA: VOC family protein [Saprospiraceae bacterium]|nr:VOC family protein [Saprospiraceae bacterium]